jgi:hypothetical protein
MRPALGALRHRPRPAALTFARETRTFDAMRALKMAALLVVATAAVLVPLYGDTRSARVTHPDWARMLVRALDLENGVPENAAPAQVFSALSWKGSLALAADRYLTATGVSVDASSGARAVVATSAEGEVVYPLTVITGGDYRVRARLRGAPARPASAEIVASGQAEPSGSVRLTPAAAMGWADGGTVHLDRGAYAAIVRLPAGTSMERLHIAPPCVAPVEPLRGWAEDAVADTTDVAVTVVKAIDREDALPPAAPAVEVAGEAFHDETVPGAAGPKRSVVFVDLPEAGLYTISAFGVIGGGQGWTADACRKAMVCARPTDAPGWHPLMSATFNAGRHVFTVTLRDGALVERLRAEKKKAEGPDYVETLRGLGFDVGASGNVTRAKATDAAAFVRERGTALIARGCGDLTLPDSGLRTASLRTAGFAGPAGVRGESGQGPNPIADPAVLLAAPAPEPSPVPSPSAPPSPSPSPSAPPASPSPAPTPSPLPTPSIIPPQPPASGVTPRVN